MRIFPKFLPLLILMTVSFDTSAHLLHDEVMGVKDGFMHPIVGLDHLLAMTGIGFWLGTKGSRFSFRMLVLLLLSLILGALFAVLPASTIWLEPGLASSVILLGILIAGQFPRYVGYGLSIAAGLIHGYAHGLEIPPTTGALAYGLGFLTATASLQTMGWFLGSKARHSPWINRLYGALMMTAGTQMLFS